MPSPAAPKHRTTVSDLIERQGRKEDSKQQRDYFYTLLRNEGFEIGDDQAIVTSSRPRRRNSGSPRFQRYQFRLRTTGDRNSRWDRGLSPAIYDSMSANKEVRQSGLDPDGGNTAGLYQEASRIEPDFDANTKPATPREPVSIANVAQSMPRGFSVGVLSASFDFVDVPRDPTPDTAWVFDDQRFWFFISGLTTDEALNRFDVGPRDWAARELLARPLKTFTALYNYFRVGRSDRGFLSDSDLRDLQFWTSCNALKRYRSRLLRQGLEMFGTPDSPKMAPSDIDWERVKRVRNAVTRLYRCLTATFIDSAA